MSKAKLQSYQSSQTPAYIPQQTSSIYSSFTFFWGFLLGQLTLAAILFVFIKFFIFGEAPSADERAATRAAARKQRTLSHTRQRTLSTALRPRPSVPILRTRNDGGLTVQKILEKTYYNVRGHQPESLDWFNVLIAQTIAQLRADALEDEAVLTSLNTVLNGSSRPDFLDEIRVTEISLGEEFPIFSNCRVIPVDENGVSLKELTGHKGERLQARMDVDLSDMLTLGIETKLVLNYPKPCIAVLPVALAVTVVRFSGTLSLSFSPSSQSASPSPTEEAASPTGRQQETNDGHPLNPSGQSPTTLTFTFLDDYRLDLSVHSLIGSRSRLQDVPKIAQLVEARIHQWFDERCVEPRFQQIVLPSLWPRKKTTRGGEDEAVVDDAMADSQLDGTTAENVADIPRTPGKATVPADLQPGTKLSGQKIGAATTAEQRTRDWAAQHASAGASPNIKTNANSKATSNTNAAGAPAQQRKETPSEIELAGEAMRQFDDRLRRKEQRQATLHGDDFERAREESGLRMRVLAEVGRSGGEAGN